MPARRVVIGIGNPDRGDDAAGIAVVRRLRGALPEDVAIVEHGGAAAALLAALDGATAAFLVDACASGAEAGTIRRLDLGREALPPLRRKTSSHGLGVAEALALARALGQFPARCIAYLIEGQCFDLGAGLSPAIAGAVNEVARQLRAELSAVEESSCPATGRAE